MLNRASAFLSLSLTVTMVSVFSHDRVEATPIQYVFEGTGNGVLGSMQFTNASFTITAIADTGNIRFSSLQIHVFSCREVSDFSQVQPFAYRDDLVQVQSRGLGTSASLRNESVKMADYSSMHDQ